MTGLALWLGTGLGRVAMCVMLLAALGALRAWDVSHQQQNGVVKERARVEETGRKIDAKAQAARRRAETAPPNEIDAGLRRYCRDC